MYIIVLYYLIYRKKEYTNLKLILLRSEIHNLNNTIMVNHNNEDYWKKVCKVIGIECNTIINFTTDMVYMKYNSVYHDMIIINLKLTEMYKI